MTDLNKTLDNMNSAASNDMTNNLFDSIDEAEDEELRELALSFTPGLNQSNNNTKINLSFYNDSPLFQEDDDKSKDEEIFSPTSNTSSYDDDLSYELNRLSAVEEDLRLELETVSTNMIVQQKQQQLYNIHSQNRRVLSPKGLTSLADESDDDDDGRASPTSSSIISTNIPFTYSTNEITTPTNSTTTCCTFTDFYNESKAKKALFQNNNLDTIAGDFDTPTPSCLCM